MKKLTGTYYLTQEYPENAIISVANYLGKPYPHPLNQISDCEYWSVLETTYVVEEISKYSFVVQVFEDI